MSENDEFKKVDVSEEGHGNTYIVRILMEDEAVLVGGLVQNANKGIRVEKDSNIVRFLKKDESFDNIEDLRKAELRSIRPDVPDWVRE